MINWNEHREQVRQLLEQGKTINEIATELDVTVYVLNQFLHRNRIFTFSNEHRNLAKEIIKIKFIHIEYFRPTRAFYEAVGIRQRRWWQLFRGEERMTENEYKNLVLHLGVTLQEAFEARQINLFDDLDKK